MKIKNKGNTMASAKAGAGASTGITVLNSQGTKVFILDVPATAWTDCAAAVTAIQAGQLVGCPQSLGSMTATRSSTTYKCLSSNQTAKSLGAIEYGNLEIGLLLDPNDKAGQAAIKKAFADNTEVIVGIELSNMAEGTPAATPVKGNGTVFWFKAGVSSVATEIAMDAAVLYNVTLEISSEITECPMKENIAKTP